MRPARGVVNGLRGRRRPPAQGLILRVAFAQLPGQLGLGQLHTHVKGVGRVVLQLLELGEQGKRILPRRHAIPVKHMDALLRHLHPVAGIPDLRGQFGDLGEVVGERFAVMDGQQRAVYALGQVPFPFRRVHDAPGPVRLPQSRAGVGAHFRRQHMIDVQFRNDAKQRGVNAAGVRLRQLGQVADAHHDVLVGKRPPQGAIAHEGIGEAEVYGLQDAVGDAGPARRAKALDQAAQGRHLAAPLRHQHRHGGAFFSDPGAALLQAQQIIGAGSPAPQQLLFFHGIHADSEARLPQGRHGLLQVRKRGVRQAPQVDHIGAVGLVAGGPGQDRVNADPGRIDDLGENFD